MTPKLKEMKIRNEKKLTVETIKNGNGTAIKFSDGTMMCYGRFDIPKDTQNKVITFPASFIDVNYTVAFTNTYTNSLNIVYTIAKKTTSDMYVYPRNPSDNMVPTLSTRADYMAIGKWK